ncbi:sensor histidine kinase [Maribacter polysiphoniae]|uniref:histidine kinase n=1 Tax=Maribacter polysiphoniae TaxID=429344 RepID=A0A316E6D1_9FLAO|nr:sensor histidine kinase [Maribacter polysiphoniae]MBD1259357.1 sensor histidine kinase [Maribacter polysiphoniae]PWK24919.1 tetratricopeptide repeat protein [Maribacter polysiphoniae]
MKLYLRIFILLFYTVNSYSQSRIIDSLKIELNKEEKDSLKAKILYDLSYEYLYQSIDTMILFSKNLEKLAIRMNSDKYKSLANKSLGDAFLYSNMYDSANTHFKKALHFDIRANKSSVYSSMGILYKRQGKYEEALTIYLKGLKEDEVNGNDYGRYIKLANIGNLYMELKDYKNSIVYSKKALELAQSTKNESMLSSMGTLLNNIGGNYSFLNEYDTAIHYLHESLNVNMENNNKRELARTYTTLGSVYSSINQDRKSLEYLKMALKFREELGDKIELVETKIALGFTYGKTNQINKSNYYFDEALTMAMEIENMDLISQTYLAISDYYSLVNKYEKALLNYRLFIKFKDSILKINNFKNIQELQTKYETEKKDNEIASQKLQLQEKENDILKKKNQYNMALGGGGFLLLGSLGLWLFYRQRQKIKNNEILALESQQEVVKLEALIDGEEKERNRLAQDLHDGINGDLAVIKYKISSIEPDNFSKKEKVFYDEAISMLDNAVEQVRRISHNLAPPSLHNFDLIEAIQQFCSKQNASNPLNISFQYFGNRLILKKENETAIYRIIQELINNIIKHANATEALVQLNNHGNKLIITVEDNGQGFDTNSSENGIGLQNIKSRVNFLKANLDINSNTKGTTFCIEIDLKKNKL